MAAILEREVNTYECHRDKLLGNAEGKYVLIHGEEVVDVFEAKIDGVRRGYEMFGNVAFLVKKVVKVESPQNFVSNLGI